MQTQRPAKKVFKKPIIVQIKPDNMDTKDISINIDSANTALKKTLAEYTTLLNKHKDKLGLYTSCRNYNAISSAVDLYRPMRFELMNGYNAQLVTNAWMKYYELYCRYDVAKLPKSKSPLRAFCNAELPGASICALNHYCVTNRLNLDWRASSYVSATTGVSQSDVLGDKYGLWEKNRDHWLMTADKHGNNGDATVAANLLDWEARIGPNSKFGGVHLYSHDAGIDVTTGNKYGDQEILNAKIHLGCAIAGFLTLVPGGTFIAKQYTFFAPITYSLMYLYSLLFDNFYIDKPVTSRPYNSEIYLVGVGFRGLPKHVRGMLFDKLTNFTLDAICNIPISDQILTAAKMFMKSQIDFLDEYSDQLKKYSNDSNTAGLFAWTGPASKTVVAAWLKKYHITRLMDSDHLPATSRNRESKYQTSNYQKPRHFK